MPIFTIETTYRLPVFRHRTVEAATLEEACLLAIEDDDWKEERHDYESVGATYVTGVWEGADAAYQGDAVAWPARFDDPVQRKADHYPALLEVLRLPARKMGLSRVDFDRWLPDALAAVARADAILTEEAHGAGEGHTPRAEPRGRKA